MKNNNNKDNRLIEFTIFILLITIIAISLVAGTFAKYTTAVSGSSTATVAKWSVKLNGQDITTQTEDVTFDLFSNDGVFDLEDANITDRNNLANVVGVVDEDVVKSGKKVAPGTWGYVLFNVSNESDVKANYLVTINSIETTLPLKFSVDGSTWETAEEIKTALEDTSGHKLGDGSLDIGSTTAQNAEVKLYWKWDFEAKTASDELDVNNDANDTALGATGRSENPNDVAKCTVRAGVVFTQVD